MPDPEKMIAAVHGYVAAFEAGSADQVATLYAQDATVEDPIGAPIHHGREAIRAFYAKSMKAGMKLAGVSTPCSGWTQRIRASKPATLPSRRSTTGW